MLLLPLLIYVISDILVPYAFRKYFSNFTVFHSYIKLEITAMCKYTWPHITEERWCGDVLRNLALQISVL